MVVFYAAVWAVTWMLPAEAEVVKYTWNIHPRRSRTPLSPDCFQDRDMLLINDNNPGEVLRASVGDTVKITMINNSPSEALTMHFHGISMYNQPYSDGAATRSQCDVGPMQTLVTEFDVMEQDVGFHYYHGHTSLDRGDGLQGPIVIEDPNKPPPFEFDEELLLFLQDWYHRPGPSQRIGLDSVPFIWVGNAQAFLMNGKSQYSGCLTENSTEYLAGLCDLNCSSATDMYLPHLQVEPGKTYLLRIVNAATLVAVNLAIANHTLTVVQADGTYVEPFNVTDLDIGVAQRYSVLLTADQPEGSYWMETSNRFRDGGPVGRGYLRYNDSPAPVTDANATTTILDHPDVNDVDSWAKLDASLKTLNPSDYETSSVLSATIAKQYVVVGTQVVDAESGLLRWAANNLSQSFPASPTLLTVLTALEAEAAAPWPDTIVSSFVELPSTPLIPFNYTENLQNQSSLITTNLEAIGDVVLRLQRGDPVEIIMQNALALNGKADFHSWHLHGHSFWVVGQGQGNFDPETDVSSFNLKNPVRRDTLSLLPYGWTAVRFVADNPGAWPFHCTLAAHAVMGMGFTLVTSPDMLPPPPPGLSSCLQTSMNPADAQVCSLVSEAGTSSSFSVVASWSTQLAMIVSFIFVAPRW